MARARVYCFHFGVGGGAIDVVVGKDMEVGVK
jgi:hypothetical protein